MQDNGASAQPIGPSQAEPEGVSALRADVPCAARAFYEARPDTFFTGIVSNGEEVTRPIDWDELTPSRKAEIALSAGNPKAFDEARINQACVALDAMMDGPIIDNDWDGHVRRCVIAVVSVLV